jgi:DNA-binding GntR family transcriptional regulator
MLWARHAGYLALLLLVREMLRKNDQPGPPLTFQALAKTLDVSRTHVRKIFADAAAKGFVRVGGRGGHEVTILEPLRQAHDHWICEMGAGYDALTLQALALMERGKDALV